jgi:hypothetical protein
MATIRIQRPKMFGAAVARKFRIYIDGTQVGMIGYGQQKEFETTAGRHTVTAKIDWCGSPDVIVNLNENETKCLTVKSRGVFVSLFVSLFQWNKYLTLE